MTRFWTALPNFVDCDVYRPAASVAEKQALRLALGIPADAMVFISVAALKRVHKRVDHVISEFKSANRPDSFLVLAGAATHETPDIQAAVGGDARIRVFPDYPHERIPELLRAADVMVLGSLFEMMPIAILEGLATGLPCIVNKHPVLEWMTGTDSLSVNGYSFFGNTTKNPEPITNNHYQGGMAIDMAAVGELARVIAGLTKEWVATYGSNARARAVGMFSKEVVIGQYVDYYRRVLEG